MQPFDEENVITADYFVFLQESLSKVLTNQNMFSKQNQMSVLH